MDEIEKLKSERDLAFIAIREIGELKKLLNCQLNSLIESTIIIDRKIEEILRKCSSPLSKHNTAKG